MSRQTITETEYEVMKILWSSSKPLTVGELYKMLPENKWSKTTVATLLVRLCDKGAAAYKKEGAHHCYYPVLDKNDYTVKETKSFVSRLFEGSVKNLIASLYDSRSLTEQDIDDLRKLLEKDK